MATTHIKRSASASRLVNYAEKRAVLKDGINIDVDYAKSQLKQVREIYGNAGSTEAYASRISFSPDELDPKNADDQRKALAIARDIYEKTYPNQQVALYEHADTDSLHIHAVIGAINLETGNKMHGNWHEFREKLVNNTDEVVQEYGLKVTQVDPERYEKRSMAEIKLTDKGQTTWKDEIRQAVDSVMSNARISDFETFTDVLREKSIEVYERGKDVTYRLLGTNYKARGKKLGTAYEKGAIQDELEKRTRNLNPDTRKPDTKRIDDVKSNVDGNQELSGNANTTSKQATNRIDGTTVVDRKSQSTGQSGVSNDLERFREQQRKQQRAIRSHAEQRSREIRENNQKRQSTDDRRITRNSERSEREQQNLERPKREPKQSSPKHYGPTL